MPQICWVYNLGLIPYQIAWNWQQKLLQERCLNPHLAHALILLEHPPVYTLGQGATEEFLKFNPENPAAELYRVERGGEVTYHCPGQLVAYPILNLRLFQPDLHWYLRQLEAVVIQTLATYGIVGERIPGLTGVWVQGVKIAAIGIKVSRWITMHGLALNVCPDLQGFTQIVPCGIRDRQVGSLAQFVPEVEMHQVRQTLMDSFAEIFNLELLPQTPPAGLGIGEDVPPAPCSNQEF